MKPVLVVEDHPLVAEAMVGLLNRVEPDLELTVSEDAFSARSWLSRPEKEWFRIFLDLDVPGAYGLSLAREIKSAGHQARCCIVTALNKPELIVETESLGFLGFVGKALPFAEFELSLARILKGERTFPDADLGGHTVTRLTRRQEQVLASVGQGMSSKEISRELHLTEGSVNNCVTAAMKALSVTSRSHAVTKALELGLLTLQDISNSRSDKR